MVDLILQIVGTVAVVIIAISLTAAYWRRAIKKVRAVAKEQIDKVKARQEADMEDQLEEQLQSLHMDRMKDRVALEKQAQIMSSKLDFYYKVLTEVQTLHNGMTSYMELLDSADLKPSQAEWHELRSHMDECADYIREMVDSTLKIMYYEDMKQVERKDLVAVNSFCQEVFESCQHYMNGDVDQRVETHLEDEDKAITNQGLLKMVLVALLRSSMQFTHEGEIVLEVKRYSQDEQNYLMFSVSDTGLGIPNDVKEIAFEKLPDTDISIKIIVVRLRLCRALVRLLGGKINIDTHYTPGTRIYFNVKV